jgi:hypothetical protein
MKKKQKAFVSIKVNIIQKLINYNLTIVLLNKKILIFNQNKFHLNLVYFNPISRYLIMFKNLKNNKSMKINF